MYLVEITRAARVEDIELETDSLSVAKNFVAQHALEPDGWRIFEWEVASGDLISGHRALLRTRAGDVYYDTLLAALGAAPMDAGEPYEVFDSPPLNEDGSGSGPATCIRRRISRFQADYEPTHEEPGYTGGGSIDSVILDQRGQPVPDRQAKSNDHGRFDPDRF